MFPLEEVQIGRIIDALSCIDAGIPGELNEPGKIEDQLFTVLSRNWRYVFTRTGAEDCTITGMIRMNGITLPVIPDSLP
jgi:hypothetical protein